MDIGWFPLICFLLFFLAALLTFIGSGVFARDVQDLSANNIMTDVSLSWAFAFNIIAALFITLSGFCALPFVISEVRAPPRTREQNVAVEIL